MQTELLELPKTDISIIANKIETGLQAFEQRKEDLTALQQKSHGLTITNIDDTTSIKMVSAIRKELKSARVAIEKEGKLMRDPLTQISKSIKAKEDELVAIIEPTEKELAVQEKWVADENARIEKEKDDAEKARIQVRIDKLAEYRYAIEYTTIMVIDDVTFDGVLANAKSEHEKELSVKAEEKRLADLAAEKLEAERKELELLRQQQAEAQRIIDENNARIAKEQAEKERAIVEEQERIKSQNLAIEQEKKRIEAERLRATELEQAKKEATEMARLKAIEDTKIEAQQKIEAERLQKNEDERQAALRPDKEKLQSFADKLVELKPPVVNDEKAIAICEGLQELINKTHTYLLNKIKSL